MVCICPKSTQIKIFGPILGSFSITHIIEILKKSNMKIYDLANFFLDMSIVWKLESYFAYGWIQMGPMCNHIKRYGSILRIVWCRGTNCWAVYFFLRFVENFLFLAIFGILSSYTNFLQILATSLDFSIKIIFLNIFFHQCWVFIHNF